MEAEIGSDGTVLVEGHHVGELQGFRFTPDVKADGPDAKAVRTAAQKALASEFEARAERFGNSPNGDVALGSDGLVRWLGAPVASLAPGENALNPRVVILADEQLTGPMRDKVAARAERYVTYQISTILKPLADLHTAEGLEGAAKGIAYRLFENFGLIQRRDVAEEVRGLDQDARAALRRHGVRFGAYHIFVPALVKPAPANLLTLLWAIQNDGRDKPGFGDVTQLLATGRTSALPDPSFDPIFYGLAGYRLLGRRAVRVDILERLADLIRPALAWKPGSGKRPEGGYNGAQFLVTPAMMSILGATADDMDEILRGLGYRAQGIEAREVEAAVAEFDAAALAASAPKPMVSASAPSAETVDLDVAVMAAADTAGMVDLADEAADAGAVTSIAEANEDENENPASFAEGESVIIPGSGAFDGEPAGGSIDDPDEIASDATGADGDPLPLDAVFPGESADEPDASTDAEGEEPEADADSIDAAEASPESLAEAAEAEPVAADSVPADADPADAAPVAAVAEPKLIQVWRLQRSEGRTGQRDGNRNRGRHGGRDAVPAAAGETAPDASQEARRGSRPPRGDAPGGNRAARFKKEEGPRAPRTGKPSGDREGREGREHAGGRNRGASEHEPRKPVAEAPARRFDKPQPARIDPDSPFAKLAALRDKLGK